MHVPQPTWQSDWINGLLHWRSSADVGHAGWSSCSSEQHAALADAVVVTTGAAVSSVTVVSSAGACVTSATVVMVVVVVEGAEVSVGFVLSGFFGGTWNPPPQMQHAVFAANCSLFPWYAVAYASKLCRAVTLPHFRPYVP